MLRPWRRGFVLAPLFFGAASTTGTDFARLRADMVRTQLEARGIRDARVLRACREVERHLFVPEKLRAVAYADRPLPIGEDQTISQPYIVALMSESLRLQGDEKVLEVGTGSGYQAAILARLAKQVYSVEILPGLAESATRRLRDLGFDNVQVRAGDGYRGWPEAAPFDAIVVTCAPDDIPQPLLDQLAEGGRLVIPVGEVVQELVLVEKVHGELQRTSLAPVRFVPMTGEAEKR
jgi:protein-L-isoaspartate(D-aspartate) O-methyltransferase